MASSHKVHPLLPPDFAWSSRLRLLRRFGAPGARVALFLLASVSASRSASLRCCWTSA